MSWFATKYAWRCSHLDVEGHEVIKGSTKLFLLAIAWRVPSGCFETEPTSLGHFEELTGIQSRQLRECRARLATLGEIIQRGGGKLAVYEMPRLKGPLFAVDSPAKIAGNHRQNSAKIADSNSAIIAAENRQTLPRRAGGVLSSGCTSTESTSTTQQNEEVEAFLDWFLRAYRDERGVMWSVRNPAKVEAAVRELLAHRGLERVQAMARAMWGDTADPWLNQPTNDRGIFALRHKATYLETLVARVAAAQAADLADAWGYCFHTPTCTDSDVCREKRAAEKREAVG